MAGHRRDRGVSQRPLASFDPDGRTPDPSVPVPPAAAPAPPDPTPPTPVLPRIRLEASSIRSLEERRHRWIAARLERERRAAAARSAAAEPTP